VIPKGQESDMKDSKMSPMFELGFENRKAVLGAEHVERSWAAADDFNRPMQELVTEYCWGAIWGRDDLPRKTRSLVNVAMLTALNRQHELKIHVRGALVNGATVEEIRGVLLQTAIYCGVPAALEAFRTASDAIKAHAAEKNG
jgi:4-carboxymuconolactone decarboxylase